MWRTVKLPWLKTSPGSLLEEYVTSRTWRDVITSKLFSTIRDALYFFSAKTCFSQTYQKIGSVSWDPNKNRETNGGGLKVIVDLCIFLLFLLLLIIYLWYLLTWQNQMCPKFNFYRKRIPNFHRILHTIDNFAFKNKNWNFEQIEFWLCIVRTTDFILFRVLFYT